MLLEVFLYKQNLTKKSVQDDAWSFSFSYLIKKKTDTQKDVCFHGGEGETRTPAPVTRPTPLAGAPRHQLEYFSMVTNRIYEVVENLAERVGFEPTVPAKVRRFSRPFRYDRFGISPFVP